MATLVTGGIGFVGINLVKELAQRGHEVICFDLTPPDSLVQRFIQRWAEHVTFVQGDVLDRESLNRLADSYRITKIVHAAVYTALLPDIEVGESRTIVDINVIGTANLLELAKRLKIQRFLYVSSSSVYGEGRSMGEVLHEEASLKPRNLYAITKYTSELLSRRFGELHGFEGVSVRLSAPYGPMERISRHRAVMSAMYSWTGNAIRGEPIQASHLNLGRDYTYVTDTVAGISTILDAPSLQHDVYNVSAGHLYTGEEIITVLQQARPGLQVVDADPEEFAITRPESVRGALDVYRMRDELGFIASFDLAAGIGDYLQWRESFPFRE